ncbi:MAG: KamA family radical SAM protein [Syntrophaceae bacterium]|nr:KamA family radical SAM protein [Syntrophaceae bacterium]
MNKKTLLSLFDNATSRDWQDWRWQLKNRFTKISHIKKLFGEDFSHTRILDKITGIYPMAVTPYYLSLIKNNISDDPVAAQCIPDMREITLGQKYPEDPLEEDTKMPVPKLIHRYTDRCLALVTEVCAVHCRHCNRKRFWAKPKSGNFKTRLGGFIRYLEKSPQIREVIISGGDPLIYDDEKLESILAGIKTVRSVEIIRIGSRAPAVMPMRITKNLCRILKRYRPLWFNTQFNSPAELTADAARACNMLQEAGIPVSNQAVLLKGVNDSEDKMRALLYGLQKISVRPYYLFHCEPVKGCRHFRTSIESGIKMMENLRRECSGLALPQYVADIPGKAGKIPLVSISSSTKAEMRKFQYFFDNFT